MRKGEHPIAVIIADIDEFKKLNASFGYESGDEALKALADIFADIVTDKDLLVRWRVNEFAFTLPETTNQDAGARAEKCRKLL